MKIVIAGPVETPGLGLPQLSGGDPTPHGLGGTPVTNLVTALIQSDHDITVVTLDHQVPVGEEVTLESPQLRVRYGPYRNRHRARDMFRVERTYITEAIRAVQPDVVHAHWQYEFALGALSSGAPVLVTCHDWAPAVLRQMPSAYRAVRLMMQAVTLRRARWVSAVSPYVQSRVRRWATVPIELVPNAVPELFFKGNAPRVMHGNGELIAVNTGFSGLKNVRTLLQAFARLHRAGKARGLTLVGSGYGPDGLAARWAVERGLSSGVRFVGSVSNDAVPGLLATADLFVHPSLLEACPMVMIEAMAQGLPVVGGERSGGVPWVLDGGRAGALTDVTNAQELARTIEQLTSDSEEWHRLSRAGQQRAWNEFHPETVKSKYLRLYARAARRGTN